jgi:HEAT repeat protein
VDAREFLAKQGRSVCPARELNGGYFVPMPVTLTGWLESFMNLRNKNGLPSVLSGDREAVQVLLYIVKSADSRRTDAAVILYVTGALRDLGAFSTLAPSDRDTCMEAAVNCLSSKDPPLSMYANDFLHTCAQDASIRTVRSLATLLQDQDQRVRAKAIKILGRIGPNAAPAVPALVRLLRDTSVIPTRTTFAPTRTIADRAAQSLLRIDRAAARRAGVQGELDADQPEFE